MKICPTCKAEYAGGEVFCPVDATRLSSPSQIHEPQEGADPLVGSTLNERYRILGRIGEGGMGIVYEAEHVVIEKRVALKVLREDFSSRPEVVERFRQEAKSASRIGHEHIVDISDFGETPSKQSYFVMEFLKGEDLANLLAREGTVAPERAGHIVLQCCRALGAAHAKGIVHRDMKPENVFLVRRDGAEDFVKIVDFGIAKMSDIETSGAPGRKLTKTGMIFGTPEYMSPEQAAGKELDHRVDIYAVGTILFEMLTGRVPFVGDSFMGILTQHMFEPPPALREVNPNVTASAELESVILRAIAKDPDERYQTMDELAQDLQIALGWVKGEPTSPGFGRPVAVGAGEARSVGPQPTSPDEFPARRKGARLGMIAAAALGALAIGGAGAWFALQPDTSTADTDDSGDVGAPPTSEGEGGGEGASPTVVAVANGPPEGTGGEDEGEEQGAGSDEASDAGAAEQAAAKETVEISVTTRPSGAAVSVDGRGTVCDESPCSFEAAPGEAVRLLARRGRWVGSRKVTASQDESVEIRLRPRRRPSSDEGQSQQDDPRQGDLKVPDIFR